MAYTPTDNVSAVLSMTPGEAPKIAFSDEALQRLTEIETAARNRTLTAAQARDAAALFGEAEQAAQHAASMAGITLDTSDPIPHFDSADATADYLVARIGADARAGRLTAAQARTARELFSVAAGHLSAGRVFRHQQPRGRVVPPAAVHHHTDSRDSAEGPHHMTDSDDLRPEIERQRKLQLAQQRRSRAPLKMTKLDAWDTSQLSDRPNTSTAAPDGATGKPKPSDKGANVKPDGATAPSDPAHKRSFADLGVPGGMSKPRGRGPFDYREDEHPDHDPETAA